MTNPLEKLRIEKDVLVQMRDGIHLSLDLYFPKESQGQSFPALFAASAYGKDFNHLPACSSFRFRETGPIEFYVRRGYVFVHVDVRGTGKSVEGTWKVFDEKEQQDLFDTIEWIGVQPWCNGRVGMIGESYYACSQWFAAVQNPPHLKCIAPFGAYTDCYRDLAYHGGILSDGFLVWWFNNTRLRFLLEGESPKVHDISYDFVGEAAKRPLDCDWYKERSTIHRLQDSKVPAYVPIHWGMAVHLRGNLDGYNRIQSPKKLQIFADLNDSPSEFNGSQAIFETEAFQEKLFRWYDYWLKDIDTKILEDPQVQIHVRGDSGKVIVSSEWPPKEVDYVRYYLSPTRSGLVSSINDGSLSTAKETGAISSVEYSYPQPNWGGFPGTGVATFNSRGVPNPTGGVLTFTSPPLTDDVTIVGNIKAVLYVSCDQIDTDLFVKISDQSSPEGKIKEILKTMDLPIPSTKVTTGWLKASHRKLDPEKSTFDRPHHPHKEKEPLVPNTIYAFEIEVWPVAFRFQKGHSIRVEISTGDSSVFDAPMSHWFGVKKGKIQLWHDADHPSHVQFPVYNGK